MKKKALKTKLTDKHIYIILIALLIVIGIMGVAAQNYAASLSSFTEEESLEIAGNAVLGSPTYVFDGYELQHVRTVAARCPSCWIFTFRFKSSHAGYGDRKGQALEQAITQHSANIAVSNGELEYAIIDEVWDIMNQQYLPGKEVGTPPEAPSSGDGGVNAPAPNGTGGDSGPFLGEPPLNLNDTREPQAFCGWNTNASCNSDAGCKRAGCSSQVCISLSQFSVTTTCEWRDCYNASAYGLECRCVDNKCQWAG